MSWLVTGASGYIGSHIVAELITADVPVEGLDLIESEYSWIKNNLIDLRNFDHTEAFLKTKKISGIIHCAGLKSVAESVIKPSDYYQTNYSASINLFKSAIKCNIKNFIFASTAAVYGDQTLNILDEKQPCEPINPYGDSKLKAEVELSKIAQESDINLIILRYFNVAGQKLTKLSHLPEGENVFPILFRAGALSQKFNVFGSNLATRDGTCVRDYLHISDLTSAHLKMVQVMQQSQMEKNLILNLGSGVGTSVLEIIENYNALTGRTLDIDFLDQREGDPEEVVANIDKIMSSIDWSPNYGINEILTDYLALGKN
jgi:UDP-glucose 4-epimerase